MDEKIVRTIKKIQRVIRALTGLALEIGTLLAIIKMIIESIR